MQTNNATKIALGLALSLQLPAMAGTPAPIEEAPAPAANNGDFCSWLQNKPGTLYKNKENPYLQEFQIEGRFQYQAAYIEGSNVTGNDVNETFDEYRRVRLGAKAKFLNYFGAKYQVNLVDDGRPSGGDLDWQYIDIDEAYLSFNLGKALGENYFDELELKYGRHKYLLGYEAHLSSTKLLTIERSSLSNKVYGSYRMTGLVAEAAKGDWTYGAGIYSSSKDGANNEEFSGFQDGEVFWLNAGFKASDKLTFGADFAYNNADVGAGEDSVMGYEWATAINAAYEDGAFGIVGELTYGDNGDDLGHAPAREGAFYGVMVMPYYWLVDKKLQAVAQFEYMGSEEDEGVRVNSRYGSRLHTQEGGFNSGRGDSHASLYTGLNYYLCGHNAKIQGGIEYQQMDTPLGDFDTLTYLIAFRSYF